MPRCRRDSLRRQQSKRHSRRQGKTGLVAASIFRVGGGIADDVQAWNGMASHMDGEAMRIDEQPSRTERDGVPLDAEEGRAVQRAKAGAHPHLAPAGFAAMELRIAAAAYGGVETIQRAGQSGRIVPQFGGQRGGRFGMRHPGRDRCARGAAGAP